MAAEWLEGFSVEYLVQAVHELKEELLRRGLDECGVEMPILEVAEVMGMLNVVPVPREAHHVCGCGWGREFHEEGCVLARTIRECAFRDERFQREYLEALYDD